MPLSVLVNTIVYGYGLNASDDSPVPPFKSEYDVPYSRLCLLPRSELRGALFFCMALLRSVIVSLDSFSP